TALLLRVVHVAQLRDVRGRAAASLELEHDALPERSGRRVQRLLRRGHPTGRVAARDDPPDTQAGEERLRKAANGDDLHGAVARGQRRDVLAAVTKETVRVVLDDERAVRRGEREQRGATVIRQGLAGRVLEVRHHEEHPWADSVAAQYARGLGDVDALV